MDEYEDYISGVDPAFEEFLMDLNFGGYVPIVPADDDNGEEEGTE